MNNTSRTAAQLRHDFDSAFAEAAREATQAQDDFLAIRIGADTHALRLAEIVHLMNLTAWTPLPGPLPAMLGVIGFRGAIVPVYDLRLLLGYPAQEPPRWSVVVGDPPVALAFDAFEGHLRLAQAAHVRQADGEAARRHVRELLHTGDMIRPVVAVASLLEAIKTMVKQPGPT